MFLDTHPAFFHSSESSNPSYVCSWTSKWDYYMWFTAWKLVIGLAILAWSYLINCEIVIWEETFFQAIIFHIRNVSLEILLPQVTGENHNCYEWEWGWSMQKFLLIKVSWKGLKISLSGTARKKIKERGKDQQGYHHTSLAESTCAFTAQQKAT